MILYKLLPKRFRRKLQKKVDEYIKSKRQAQSRDIPCPALSPHNVKNGKLITSRLELLRLLPRGGIVAELGVDKGEFSELILLETKPRKLHLVDVWGSARYHEGLFQAVQERFQRQVNDGVIEINRGRSTAVGNQFPDRYFDWVYIDTDHSYKTTKSELEVYANKVKDGGIIAGHDFIVGNWKGDVRYGVREAVYEFCIDKNWEIIYQTTELNAPSFAIRKIA